MTFFDEKAVTAVITKREDQLDVIAIEDAAPATAAPAVIPATTITQGLSDRLREIGERPPPTAFLEPSGELMFVEPLLSVDSLCPSRQPVEVVWMSDAGANHDNVNGDLVCFAAIPFASFPELEPLRNPST